MPSEGVLRSWLSKWPKILSQYDDFSFKLQRRYEIVVAITPKRYQVCLLRSVYHCEVTVGDSTFTAKELYSSLTKKV